MMEIKSEPGAFSLIYWEDVAVKKLCRVRSLFVAGVM